MKVSFWNGFPRLCLSPGLEATSHRACQAFPSPCPGASGPLSRKDGRGLVGAAGLGCSREQPDQSLSQWGLSQAGRPVPQGATQSESITVGPVPGGQASAPRSNPIRAYHSGVCPRRVGQCPRVSQGHKGTVGKATPTLLYCSRDPCCRREPPSRMLQTLLISGTLALLTAAPGQAQVPIQADFDASQVRMDVPRLAASL